MPGDARPDPDAGPARARDGFRVLQLIDVEQTSKTPQRPVGYMEPLRKIITQEYVFLQRRHERTQCRRAGARHRVAPCLAQAIWPRRLPPRLSPVVDSFGPRSRIVFLFTRSVRFFGFPAFAFFFAIAGSRGVRLTRFAA